jgi:hypothetical protein
MGQPTSILGGGSVILRATVGRRRLLADGTRDDSPLAKFVSMELHTDGAGVCSMCVLDLSERNEGALSDTELTHRRVHDESLVMAVMSGLQYLAKHARDRAAAGGNALIRAQIFPVTAERPTALAQNRFYGFTDMLGARVLTVPPPAAEAAVQLDDLAQPGPVLVAASALLVTGAVSRSSPGPSSTASRSPTTKSPEPRAG